MTRSVYASEIPEPRISHCTTRITFLFFFHRADRYFRRCDDATAVYLSPIFSRDYWRASFAGSRRIFCPLALSYRLVVLRPAVALPLSEVAQEIGATALSFALDRHAKSPGSLFTMYTTPAEFPQSTSDSHASDKRSAFSDNVEHRS